LMATIDVNFISAPQLSIQKGDTFQIEVVETAVTATVNAGGISYSVSGMLPSPGGWNHVVVTYSAFTLTLYLNGVPSNQIVCSGSLDVNTNPIIIGDGFYGYLDELGIYAQALDATGVAIDYVATNHYA
jgi:hypothetical protein